MRKLQYLLPAIFIAILISETVTAFDDKPSLIDRIKPVNVKALKLKVPKTLDEVKLRMVPVRGRYLMWTHDGRHIMWGIYGNGYFTGTDNLGKRAWGIYGKGIFAGFYNGNFFWGKYRNGFWKAEYLFGEERSHGRYVLFPTVVPVPVSIARG